MAEVQGYKIWIEIEEHFMSDESNDVDPIKVGESEPVVLPSEMFDRHAYFDTLEEAEAVQQRLARIGGVI